MPKIYGAVAFKGGELRCNRCGFAWAPSNDEMLEVKSKHKVSCLMCRALNEVRVGEFLPKSTGYMLGSAALVSSTEELRGESYQDKEAHIVHSRCKRVFKAKLSDIRQGTISCPHCNSAERKEISQIVNKPINTVTTGASGARLTEIVEKQPKLIEDTDLKVKDIRNSGEAAIGKVIRKGIRLMGYNKNTDECTLQCTTCGAEMLKSLNVLVSSKGNSAKLLCGSCQTNAPCLADLKRRYLGKVFNGLRVEKIYTSETGDVLCNLVCQQHAISISIPNYINTMSEPNNHKLSLRYKEKESMHIKEMVPLGDVINNRVWCPICGKDDVSKAPRYKNLNCDILDMIVRKTGKRYTLELSGVTVEKFLGSVKTGSLCDYCTANKVCKVAGQDPKASLGLAVALIDMRDNALNEMLQVATEHSGLFAFKNTDSSNVQLKPESGLIVIKDLYVGSDGSTYKACKCTRHGSELVLSDSEIAAFEHEQCNNKSVYMRFFDIKRTVYLQKSV